MPVPGGWKPTEEQDADDTSETGEEGQTAETAEFDAPEENHINIEETGEELQEKEDTVSEETNGKNGEEAGQEFEEKPESEPESEPEPEPEPDPDETADPDVLGLTQAQVDKRVGLGKVNDTGENIFKTKKEIIRDHTLTYFNFLNLALGCLILISGQIKKYYLYGHYHHQLGDRNCPGNESKEPG